MVKVGAGVAAPPSEEETLSKSLKSAAFSRKLLSRSQAKTLNPVEPSKLVLRQSGKDIVKRGQRKNKFLFSLPGLLAPVSGGKIGELADLNTRNPVLFLEFPNGRMKLFGTVVYPKNKYLTLQFSKSSKGVQCEDSFENMVVFSEAWWIGTREENPHETRLEFPENFNAEGNTDCDFKGGAGAASQEVRSSITPVKETCDQSSPEIALSNGSSNDDDNDHDLKEKVKSEKQETSIRQSSRTAGKSFKFSELSGDDSSCSLDDEIKVSDVIRGLQGDVTKRAKLAHEDQILEECEEKNSQTGKVNAQSKPKSGVKAGVLVQATLSNMFEKANKTSKTNARGASRSPRGSGVKKSSAPKRSSAPSSDSSPTEPEDPDQETDDSDEEWTS